MEDLFCQIPFSAILRKIVPMATKLEGVGGGTKKSLFLRLP